MFYTFRGGMAPGPLPYAGGYAQQPSKLMTAFRIMSAAVAALNEKPDADG